MVLRLLLTSSSVFANLGASPVPIVRFGIVTDVHYADAPASSSRHYRDSLPKIHDAMADISAANADFVIELGDFKDTDATQHCADKVEPSEDCINMTIGFLRKIEQAVADGFKGPRYHVFGNHDVDILAQEQVIPEEHNTEPFLSGNVTEGYFSFNAPSGDPVGADTAGCLVTDGTHIWVIHDDSTRNWLSLDFRGACQGVMALKLDDPSIFPKRHDGKGAYTLNASDSADVCSTCSACVKEHLPTPAASSPLRFLVLNGDFTDRNVPWRDLDGPGAASQGMVWSKANVPTIQLTWLADQLGQAKAAGQHVVVFVHYRLDGYGPVSPPSSWVDKCTLQNGAVVRAILESEPGLVLATFSGHDHVPKPPFTHEDGKPLYATMTGMVEGAYAEGHNAYSLVSILDDCSVVVRGWGDQVNISVKGPTNCSLGLGTVTV